MDSLSQAVLGAAVGEAILGKKLGRTAGFVGAILGTIPDLDVLLSPFFDSLERISIHRGYSHSILFCILGAFIAAYIMNRIKWTKAASFWRLWLFAFMALFTHVLLDAFTSYGTQLLLPFTDWRVSLDSISIVDPFYTVPLLIGTTITMFIRSDDHIRRGLPNTLGLIISSLYLLFTLANKEHIETVVSDQLQEQGIPFYQMLTVPVSVGNAEWYGVVKDDSLLHMGKYSILKNNKIEFTSFPINAHLLDAMEPEVANRLIWFAQGFYTVAEYNGRIRVYNMQCDMQGVRHFGDYIAPTAFYYEYTIKPDGGYSLGVGMHDAE